MRVGNVKQQLVVSDKGIMRKIYLVGASSTWGKSTSK